MTSKSAREKVWAFSKSWCFLLKHCFCHCRLAFAVESNDDPKSWRCLLLKAARLPYFDPKCEKDGSFSPTQCDYFNTNNCWCSYKNGTRIPKTNHDRRGFDPFNCDIFRSKISILLRSKLFLFFLGTPTHLYNRCLSVGWLVGPSRIR